ncbi:MAG: ABC transporter ATP-binding protein [Bacteroidales bacterium]|nr:ABC transporter ATP-binding protein [Bacteroidales bacterium]
MKLLDKQLIAHIKKLLPDALHGKSKFIKAFLLVLIALTFSLPVPWISMKVVDESIKTENYNLLLFLVGLWGLLLVIRSLINYYQSLYIYRFTIDFTHYIRIKTFSHILKLPLAFFKTNPSGYIISRISQDIGEIAGFFGGKAISFFSNLITLTTGLIFIFIINYKLSLILFFFFPAFQIITKVFKHNIRLYDKQKKEEWAILSGILTTTINGILSVKSLFGEEKETIKINDHSLSATELSFKHWRLSAIATQLQNLTMKLFPVIVSLFAAYFIIHKEMQISELVGFIGYTGFIIGPASGLMNFNINVQSVFVSMERLIHIWNQEAELHEGTKPLAGKFNFDSSSILFKNISFNYGDEKIISDFSLRINQPEKLAIVGKTGSGKSTLLKLLLKLENLNTGSILIGETNVNDIPIDVLRKKVAFISSTPYIINATVYENISYNIEASNETIIKAAHLCGSYGFINELPEGFNTLIGENGSNISDGQKQLIVLTRIFLRNPDILLLDEATSAIDSRTEEKISLLIKNVFYDKIVILVSHRLSTLKISDRYILLENGTNICEGNFGELKSSKKFSNLFEEQLN